MNFIGERRGRWAPLHGVLSWLLVLCVFCGSSHAYETDQYSTAQLTQAESMTVLDRMVNDAIYHVVMNWNQPRDDYRLLSRIGGYFHSRQLEKWINDSGVVDSAGDKKDSVYRYINWESSPIIRWKGLARTFTLNGVQIGADKLSHFFGVGWVYWKADWALRQKVDEVRRREHVIALGIDSENGLWGRATTNVFSNADLVANWEGYLFYRSVLEDYVVGDQRAVIAWRGDRPIIQRQFSFRDHVNAFWNEALLPNDYDAFLGEQVKRVLLSYCRDQHSDTIAKRWLSPEFDRLWQHYRLLRFDAHALAYRMDNVCHLARQKNDDVSAHNNEITTTTAQDSLREKLDHIDKYVTTMTPRMRSPLASCNQDIERAINEHLLISQIDAEVGKTIREKLIEWSPAELHWPKKQRAKRSLQRRRAEEFVQHFTSNTAAPKFKVRHLDQLSVYHHRSSLAALNNLPELQFEIVFLGLDTIKQCVIVPVDFAQASLPTRHTFVKATLHYCRYQSAHKPIENRIFWRASTQDRMLRTSLADYYAIDDREAYVYRLIPKHCKWY